VYEHRQSSQWVVLIMVVMAVAFAMAAFMTGAYALFPMAALFVAVGLDFSTLTTRVGADGVSWSYTLGWPSGALLLGDIAKAEVTTTNVWLEGYGIHWTIWHGWLWNVSGYGAVMMTTRSGRRITLGTDDPQGLYQAIERFRVGA
jgi:hypothetical protein